MHYPVTKKLEALTPPATDSFPNIHFFCISIPASNPPSGRKKASSTQHMFCWQERFKTVVSDKTKTSIWTFEKPAHSYSPRGYGAIVCLSLILPLWTWHANIMLHTITFLSLIREGISTVGEGHPLGQAMAGSIATILPYLHTVVDTLSLQRWVLEENAQGVKPHYWQFGIFIWSPFNLEGEREVKDQGWGWGGAKEGSD